MKSNFTETGVKKTYKVGLINVAHFCKIESLNSEFSQLRFDIADLDDKIGELDDCLEVMNAWDQVSGKWLGLFLGIPSFKQLALLCANLCRAQAIPVRSYFFLTQIFCQVLLRIPYVSTFYRKMIHKRGDVVGGSGLSSVSVCMGLKRDLKECTYPSTIYSRV